MPYFEHNGLQFYYIQKGGGIPFIFQHGLGGSVDQVLKIYSPPAYLQLISFDCRAHGKTAMGPGKDLCFNTYADDLAALIDHLQLQAPVIGGISMGAGVALNFALRYPGNISALVVSRPAWLDGPMEPAIRALFSSVAACIQQHGLREGRQRFLDSDLCRQVAETSPGTVQSLLTQFDYEKAAETAVKLVSLPEDAPSPDREQWKNITLPTLILANESDPIHPFHYAREYADRIAGSELKKITSKFTGEEQHTKDVQKEIDLFIGRVLEKKRAV